MFSSDNKSRETAVRHYISYLAISAFCLIFGIVYHRFSHGVTSPYMGFSFLFPLAGGFLPYFIMSFFPKIINKKSMCRTVYNSGIATLTTGSLVTGIVEIYGTSTRYSVIYYIVGIILLAAGVLLLIRDIFNRK